MRYWCHSVTKRLYSQAEELGVRVHRRSNSASFDNEPANDAVFHFLWNEAKTERTSSCYLQSTSPFRTAEPALSSLGLHETNYSVPVISLKLASGIPKNLFAAVVGGACVTYLSQKPGHEPTRGSSVSLSDWGCFRFYSRQFSSREGVLPKPMHSPSCMKSLESLGIDSYEDLRLESRIMSLLFKP